MKRFLHTATVIALSMNCSYNITQQETATVTTVGAAQQTSQMPASADPEMDRFMNDLMENITLEEKIG